MKPGWRQQLLVYSASILVLAGLVFLANVYARASQKEMLATRESGLEEANGSESGKGVKILRVFPQPLRDILILPGAVEAFEDIELASKRAGVVNWIGPQDGDRVSAGEELLRLDVSVLEALAAKARADFHLAEMKYKRNEELFAQHVVPPDSFDEAEAAFKASKAVLAEVEAQLAEGAIHSPINGVLDRRSIDLGEHLQDGRTVFRVVDIDRVKVVFHVPEKDIRFFHKGQEVEIEMTDSDLPSCTGTIAFVAMSADLPARTYPIKVVVDNPDHLLRPGMIVRGHLVRRFLEKGIAVPFYTLVERENGKSLFVVEEGHAKERLITHGMFQRGMVEILEGLDAGDELIVVGQRDLVSDQKVSIAADLTEDAQRLVDQGRDLTALVMD